jgi:hypothetical protein
MMNEDIAARLEASEGQQMESSGTAPPPPNDEDARRIAARIQSESSTAAPAALAIARELVERAREAVEKKHLTDTEALALESVIHVRGRPALRVIGEHLESLLHFPGSELWQDFISDYERRIISVTAAIGGIFVHAFSSRNPRWLQGSAWMIATNRAVTNRHVLIPEKGERLIDLGSDEFKARLREDFRLDLEFGADDRNPAKSISRQVTDVLFVAKPEDPIDVAVLAIEPNETADPLVLGAAAAKPSRNLYVVGHPALSAVVPLEVKSVFGNPDGKKRVSFGQLISTLNSERFILHDASTIGGYSGAPVMGISDGLVTGLHFYGDPAAGNYAISVGALLQHPVARFFA